MVTRPDILIKKYLEGTLPEAEREALYSWLFSLPEEEAAAYFDRMGEVIDGLDKTKLEQLEQRLRSAKRPAAKSSGMEPVKPQTRGQVKKLYIWVKVAASLLILLGLSYLFIQYRQTVHHGTPLAGYTEKINENGKRSQLSLEDGTIVWLNAGSSLRFPERFGSDMREVFLEGEAFFEVARDEERPFIIRTGEVETRVLGTSFNINAYPGHLPIITVASGHVRLADAKDNSIDLRAGEQANYHRGKGFSPIKRVNAKEYTSWTRGTLNLNDKSLAEAARMLERWYGIDISLENKDLENCIIAGEHTNESLESVLEALRFVFHVNYTRSDKGIIISGKGCT